MTRSSTKTYNSDGHGRAGDGDSDRGGTRLGVTSASNVLVDAVATVGTSLACARWDDRDNLGERGGAVDSRGWRTRFTSCSGLTRCRCSVDSLGMLVIFGFLVFW